MGVWEGALSEIAVVMARSLAELEKGLNGEVGRVVVSSNEQGLKKGKHPKTPAKIGLSFKNNEIRDSRLYESLLSD